MTWTQGAGTGVWSHSGTDFDAVMSPGNFPAQSSMRLQVGDPTHEVVVLLPASFDGRTRLQAGISGSNAVISEATFATVSALATQPHGLTASQPFTMEVRYVDRQLELYLNDSDTPVVTYDNSALKTHDRLKHFGFGSAVDGAKVLLAEVCELTPERVQGAELLVAVCAGQVFISDAEGGSIGPIGQVAFNEVSDVDLSEFEQELVGVDGQHAVVINAATFEVEDLIPTEGALPGETEPGTTTATVARVFRSRMVYNESENRQNLTSSGVNDFRRLDTGDYPDERGSAFAFSAENRARIGEPIIGYIEGDKSILIVGCVRSFWRVAGDPSFGADAVDVSKLAQGVGLSGKDAILAAEEGFVLAHAPQGLVRILEGEGAINFTQDVLTEGIQIPAEDVDDYRVQLMRDTTRHRLYVLLRERAPAGDLLSFIYDERSGQHYRPGGGGLFPLDLPSRMATCSTIWRGKTVVGTSDGWLLTFDDAAKDYDGEAIAARVCYPIMDGGLMNETLLDEVYVEAGSDSDQIKYRIYRARTPEEAYTRSENLIVRQGVVPTATGKPIVAKCRGPVLLLELYNDEAGESFVVDRVQVRTRIGRHITRQPASTKTVDEVCRFELPAGSTPGGSGTGPGPGGGGGTPEPISFDFLQPVPVMQQQFLTLHGGGTLPPRTNDDAGWTTNNTSGVPGWTTVAKIESSVYPAGGAGFFPSL